MSVLKEIATLVLDLLKALARGFGVMLAAFCVGFVGGSGVGLVWTGDWRLALFIGLVAGVAVLALALALRMDSFF